LVSHGGVRQRRRLELLIIAMAVSVSNSASCASPEHGFHEIASIDLWVAGRLSIARVAESPDAKNGRSEAGKSAHLHSGPQKLDSRRRSPG